MFTLLSNASVPSILNMSWPSCFPVKCGTGKMPFVNITVWHSGWTNRSVCRFKIAKPQCCLFSFNKNYFYVQFLQCLFFQPFLFLIILGRKIGLSVNCLFTLHWEHCFYGCQYTNKRFNLIDLCGCFGFTWLFFLLWQFQIRMQNLWFWDSLPKIKFYLYTLEFITYICNI